MSIIIIHRHNLSTIVLSVVCSGPNSADAFRWGVCQPNVHSVHQITAQQ